jgi:hypothetical protein
VARTPRTRRAPQLRKLSPLLQVDSPRTAGLLPPSLVCALFSYYDFLVEIHRSARKHGITDEAINHAVSNAIVIVDLDPDDDPPRVLAIGPDTAGNLLEVIWIVLEDQRDVVIHAMGLRSTFRGLIQDWEGDE